MPYLGQAPTKGDENNFKILDNISSYTLTFDGSDAAVSRSKAVNETGVIPITVEALKVLISKVETLEAKVAALEGS